VAGEIVREAVEARRFRPVAAQCNCGSRFFLARMRWHSRIIAHVSDIVAWAERLIRELRTRCADATIARARRGEWRVPLFGKTLPVAALWLLLTTPANADGPQIAQVKTVEGVAFIVRDGSRITAKPGDLLYQQDIVETAADGAIGFTFIDNTVFSAGPGSQIALEQFRYDSSNFHGEMLVALRKGSLTAVSGDITRATPGAMKIRTPTAILGVSGTTFAVKLY
jgi:hypothetical protein